MRVYIQKRVKGKTTVVVVPAGRFHRPPVYVHDLTPENRDERVLAAVTAADAPTASQLALEGVWVAHNGAHTPTTGGARKE